jgi:hypothetical protein
MWLREPSPSLARICAVWFCTVFSLIHRASAIWRSEEPCAIRPTTSRSRCVSTSAGLAHWVWRDRRGMRHWLVAKGTQSGRLFSSDASSALLGRLSHAEPGTDPVGNFVDGDAGSPPSEDRFGRRRAVLNEPRRFARTQTHCSPKLGVYNIDTPRWPRPSPPRAPIGASCNCAGRTARNRAPSTAPPPPPEPAHQPGGDEEAGRGWPEQVPVAAAG